MLKSVLTFTSVFIIIFDYHMVTSQGGATQQIEAVVKGRCSYFKFARSPGLAPIPNADCDELWGNFSRTWTYRESCNQNSSGYENLIRLLDHPLPPNKSLFWEQTKDFTDRLANGGKRYVPLQFTLIGYIADDLTWCGQTSAPGINFTYCPPYRSCSNEVMFEFWVAVSKWYASKAQGEIHVVLNGSIPGGLAYRRDSIFSSVELANLRSGVVTKLTAFLVHDLGKPKVETCGTQSLLDLKADVLSKNIAFDCLENPPEVQYLLCSDMPESPECKQIDSNCGSLPSNKGGSVVIDKSKRGLYATLLTVVVTFVVGFNSR